MSFDTCQESKRYEQLYDDQGRLMCFCEATDELIAEGWEVAELNATKRKSRVNEGMRERAKVGFKRKNFHLLSLT